MNPHPDTPDDLAAMLADPNLLPSERAALSRLLAATVALEALAAQDDRTEGER